MYNDVYFSLIVCVFVWQRCRPRPAATTRPWARCATLPTPGTSSTSRGLTRSEAVATVSRLICLIFTALTLLWFFYSFLFLSSWTGCQCSADQGAERGDWQAEEHAAQLWNGTAGSFFFLPLLHRDTARDAPCWVLPVSTVKLWIKESLRSSSSRVLMRCHVSRWHI